MQVSSFVCVLPYKSPYKVWSCVTDDVKQQCDLQPVPNLHCVAQPVEKSCDATHGQAGSVSSVDLILPVGKALYIQVVTNVPSQSSTDGFFVRPTRLTQGLPPPNVTNNTATFYLVLVVATSLWSLHLLRCGGTRKR